MLLKESWSVLADGTNVRWLKIFHLYKGFFRSCTSEGLFVKASAQIVEPPQIVYKGTKFKYAVKGDILRCIIICTVRPNLTRSGLTVKLDTNSTLTIKKKQVPKSKYTKGVVSKSALRRKKFTSLFKKVY
jgi:ribosomal protein L14